MKPKYRITKTFQGYIVEVEQMTWSLFGLKQKWIPYIKTAGMDYCWPFCSYELALSELLRKLKIDIQFEKL
jgi:hypothetical protein